MCTRSGRWELCCVHTYVNGERDTHGRAHKFADNNVGRVGCWMPHTNTHIHTHTQIHETASLFVTFVPLARQLTLFLAAFAVLFRYSYVAAAVVLEFAMYVRCCVERCSPPSCWPIAVHGRMGLQHSARGLDRISNLGCRWRCANFLCWIGCPGMSVIRVNALECGRLVSSVCVCVRGCQRLSVLVWHNCRDTFTTCIFKPNVNSFN